MNMSEFSCSAFAFFVEGLEPGTSQHEIYRYHPVKRFLTRFEVFGKIRYKETDTMFQV